MRRMCGTAQEIKLPRSIRIAAFKGNLLCAHRQINAVKLVERERFAVGNDLARAADVDGSKLALFQKEGASGFLVVWQLNGFRRRHHAADHKAVEVGEVAAQFSRREKVADLKRLAELLCGHSGDVLRARCPADGIFKHDAPV